MLFGIKVVSSGGRVGFCQDEGPSVKKDTDYTQSVWVKGTKGATGIIQSFWDQERALGPVTKGFTMTGEWQKVSYTYHATENHNKVSWGYCYIDGGEAIFVADKVEEGGNATPWPQDAMQAAADRKAAELLATERSVTRTDEFRSVYKPVEPCMAVAMNYRTGGVVGKLAIQKQTLTLDAGCVIKHTARRYER